MLDFRTILFPVDFSTRCIQSAPYLAGVARKFSSELTLLHAFDVHDLFGYGAASSTVVYGTYADVLRQQRESALMDFGHPILDGLPVKRIMQLGEPAECIAKYAEEHGTDLIFMPTHGRGRFRRLLLGAVTSKVLHDTSRPVWTTAHAETLCCTASSDIQSIICAVDPCPDAVTVLCSASEIAAHYGAGVRLVHAIPVPLGTMDEGFNRTLFNAATQRIAARQQEAGTKYEAYVKYGTIPNVVRQFALDCAAQLTVIGRGRMTEFCGRFRTNVNTIIRDSPCPVLSV